MRLLVAGYNAHKSLSDDVELRRYVDELQAIPGVTGLELPYQGAESPWNTLGYLRDQDPAIRHAVSLVPAMLAALDEDPLVGLASTDDAARRRALDLTRACAEWVLAVNRAGGSMIDTVEVHSAPRTSHSSVSALEDSLQELRGWDWGGAVPVLEHCDADTAEHEVAKGFLPIEVELELAARVGIDMVVNWGRSAIELRTAEGVREQLRAVAERGLLRGFYLSGVSPVATVVGRPWVDGHLAARGWADGTAYEGSELAELSDSSLLTREAIAETVPIAQPVADYLGIKIGVPRTTSDEERIAMLAAHVDLALGALRV